MFFLLWSEINHLYFQTCAKSNLKDNYKLRGEISSQLRGFQDGTKVLKVEDKSSLINQFFSEETWIFKHNPNEGQTKGQLGSQEGRRDSLGRVLLNLNEMEAFLEERKSKESLKEEILQDSRIILAIENSEQTNYDEPEACFPDQIDEDQQVLRSPGFDEANEIDGGTMDLYETTEGNEEDSENNFESSEMEFARPQRFSIEHRVYCDAVVSCYWNNLPRVGRKCLCKQYYVCH